MGKTWDGWTSPAAFQRWCSAWAAECLRVLKPGGYLLAFGGTRTWHRLAVGIEDAGFELRESVAYLFGSGFPKSLDVGKAIDKANGRQFEDRYALGREIRAAREAAGLNTSDVNAWFGYRDGCQHWERQDASGARVPTLADFGVLRERLGVSDTHRALVEREEAEREKVGVGTSGKTAGMQLLGLSGIAGGDYDITAPATDAARQWHGWGTALKPAHEPIVVARKPLDGTVAQSVLKWGTGALNVDACRINPGSAVAGGGGWAAHKVETTEGWDRPYVNGVAKTEPHAAGRWPANVVLDENQAAALDQQSGTTVSKAAARGDLADHRGGQYAAASGRRIAGSDSVRGHDDSGGASRFFLTAAADPLPIEGLQERFLYTAKAPKSERPSYVKPMLRLRSDLTEEQRAHVTARLAEAGVQLD